MGAHFAAVDCITGFGLTPFPGCKASCGIVLNGLAGSVDSLTIRPGLKG